MLRFIGVELLVYVTAAQLRKTTDRIAHIYIHLRIFFSPYLQVLMMVVIRPNNIQVVFLRSYRCKFLADGVRNEIIAQVRMFSLRLFY